MGKKRVLMLCLFFLLTVLSASQITLAAAKAPKNIKLNKTKAKLYVGDTLKLKAKITPSNAKKTVKWTSSNKKVATVTSKGKVRAISKGKVVITCTSKVKKKIKAKCTITVKKKSSGGGGDSQDGKDQSGKDKEEEKSEPILFEGLYIRTDDYDNNGLKESNCIRFYEDGVMIYTSVAASEKSPNAYYPKASWFNREKELPVGQYIVNQDYIEITKPIGNLDNAGRLELKGRISGNKLILDSYSTVTAVKKNGLVFAYIPFSDIPGWE